jgi:hypothetical protein
VVGVHVLVDTSGDEMVRWPKWLLIGRSQYNAP